MTAQDFEKCQGQQSGEPMQLGHLYRDYHTQVYLVV